MFGKKRKYYYNGDKEIINKVNGCRQADSVFVDGKYYYNSFENNIYRKNAYGTPDSVVTEKDIINHVNCYGIYIIYNDNDKIFYIGEGDILERLKSHFGENSSIFSNVVGDELNEKRKNYYIKFIELGQSNTSYDTHERLLLESMLYNYCMGNPDLYVEELLNFQRGKNLLIEDEIFDNPLYT